MKKDIIYNSQTTWGIQGKNLDDNFNEIYSFINSTSLFVKKIGNTCSILTNYNQSYNLLIRFKYCLANNLYTFYEVGLLSKTKNYLLEDVEYPVDILIMSQIISDCIGPIVINGGFVGGNHLYSDGNTKTAISDYYNIKINGNLIEDNKLYKTDELIIETRNSIYDYSQLPNILSIALYEYVTYRIKKTNIEVFVKHVYQKDVTASLYYGMQANDFSSTWQKNIYVAHSNSNTLQNFTSSIDFGKISTYPSIEKAISCNTDKSICMSMFLNNVGLSATRSSRMDDSRSVFFTSNLKKQYFTLIDKYESKTNGDTYYWNGCYSFFDNSAISNCLFYHDICIGGNLIKSLDFITNGTQDLSLNDNFGKLLSILKSDSTINLSDLNVYDNKVVSSGAGNIYLKIN